MENYRKSTSQDATFTQRGLSGFQFDLQNKDVEVYRIDVRSGHDDYVKSATITHIYYVLHGTGKFVIDEEHVHVTVGEVVEIPPQHVFAYSGQMTLLLIMSPPFSFDAIEVVRPNPNVE